MSKFHTAPFVTARLAVLGCGNAGGGRAEVTLLQCREILPQLKISTLTSQIELETIRALVKTKIFGYLLKHEAPENPLQAACVIGQGASWFSQGVLPKFLESPDSDRDELLSGLTSREEQVLRLLIRGKTKAAIAEGIHIAEQTVRNVVSAGYSRLGAAKRVELLVLARNRRWFSGIETSSSASPP